MNLARCALFSGGDFVQAQRFRSYFKKAVAKVMEDLDVLITPTSVGPAPKRSEMTPEKQLVSSSFTGHWTSLACRPWQRLVMLQSWVCGKVAPSARSSVASFAKLRML